MRIQEMKSGILHLKKRLRNDDRENFYKIGAGENTVVDPGLPLSADSELEEARWSVVSFNQREAGGLTYPQAALLMSALDSHGVTGLCIVTDVAAARIRG